MFTHIYVYIYIYIHLHIYIYICLHTLIYIKKQIYEFNLILKGGPSLQEKWQVDHNAIKKKEKLDSR